MEQKTKNMIRTILVLFLFGFMMTASGIGLALKGLNGDGVVGLLMAVVGILCLGLGAHLAKNNW
jgi:hypothetical protein